MVEETKVEEYPGMDVTYEWGRQAPEMISREASSLDSKIIGVFASASVIISLLIAQGSRFTLTPALALLGLALLCYIAILVISMWALKGRGFSIADNPAVIKDRYWPREPLAVKIKYWDYVIKYYKKNKSALDIKSAAIKAVVPLLGAEVVLLLAWLFLTLILPLFSSCR